MFEMSKDKTREESKAYLKRRSVICSGWQGARTVEPRSLVGQSCVWHRHRHDCLSLQCLLPTIASSFISFSVAVLPLVAAQKSKLLHLIDSIVLFDQHQFQMNLKERILFQKQYGSTSRYRSADCQWLLARLLVVQQPVRRSPLRSQSRQENQTSDPHPRIQILQ